MIAVFLGKASEHLFHPLTRTRAAGAQIPTAKHPHSSFVKKTIEKLLGRQLRVQQFEVLDRRHKRAAFEPSFILGRLAQLHSGRNVAGVQIRPASPFLRCRQELQKKAPGPPAVPGAITIGSELLGYGQAYSRRNLFRAQKVFVRGMFEVLALQRHDSLVSCRVGALVDGHCQMALTKQCARTRTARCDRSSDPTRIESGAGAHLVRSSVIDHQHPHRTVALRLQNEAALEPKCRAEQDGEHDRLAQEPCDRRGIAMP